MNIVLSLVIYHSLAPSKVRNDHAVAYESYDNLGAAEAMAELLIIGTLPSCYRFTWQ